MSKSAAVLELRVMQRADTLLTLPHLDSITSATRTRVRSVQARTSAFKPEAKDLKRRRAGTFWHEDEAQTNTIFARRPSPLKLVPATVAERDKLTQP